MSTAMVGTPTSVELILARPAPFDATNQTRTWEASAVARVRTRIEHPAGCLCDFATARGGSPHGRLRHAILDQYPADNLRIHPWDCSCRLDHLGAGEGTSASLSRLLLFHAESGDSTNRSPSPEDRIN